jgi:hypothetical protein
MAYAGLPVSETVVCGALNQFCFHLTVSVFYLFIYLFTIYVFIIYLCMINLITLPIAVVTQRQMVV